MRTILRRICRLEVVRNTAATERDTRLAQILHERRRRRLAVEGVEIGDYRPFVPRPGSPSLTIADVMRRRYQGLQGLAE